MKLFQEVLHGKIYWSLYTDDGIYQEHISSYFIYCVDDLDLNEGTIRGRAYALRSWAKFIISQKKDTLAADNQLLKEYREYAFDKKSKNSSGDLKSRQRSVNQYLRVIYDFYCFAQYKNLAPYILGPSDIYNISSTLVLDGRRRDEYDNYPLLYRRTSSKSKHRTTYTPDYNTFLALYRYFISLHSADVAERDCLILKIAFEGGLRVGSIASLTLSDFDPVKIEASEDIFTVRPAVQKFGMSNSFEISINLAMSVAEYIRTSRTQLAKKFRSETENVFLDTNKGSALLATTISSNFSKASKKLGLPYRSGIHCWRGLFTENLIDYEIDARKELGFDSSIESIGLVVAKALGHSNPLSQQNYIRSLKSRQRSSQAFKHKQEVASLRQELLHTIEVCEELRAEIMFLTKNCD